jgi:hypothetical protein
MPVAGASGGEGPGYALRGYPGLYVVILGYIHPVIQVNEFMSPHLPVDNKCGCDEKQANDKNVTIVERDKLHFAISLRVEIVNKITAIFLRR